MEANGRVALVTGGGRGIGRSIAAALAAAGTQVVVASRSNEELSTVVREISDNGGIAAAIECDLADRNQTRTLVSRASEPFGPIDILVNNAGVGSSADPRPLADFRDEFWDLTLEVNLTAPYLLSKAALPHMREQRWGRIVTIASINGRITAPHAGAYVASKHGVLGLMRSLASEHASEGITVNCICPGPVQTRMNDIRVKYDAERLGRDLLAHEKQLTPIGGRLLPEDIAPMAVYLVSESARMITGQAYNIDGGICMA
ncbi:MAG: SDR family oxidoreductase [Planctomycetaceae bacterium]|nr:SDR family oxidoreductase [Planctomycetales bacterium]MCB9923627.1 SDR family oxidoreductase [Planctomycetaceae bacterium]